MSKVVYSDAAAKTLSRMDRATSRRIMSKVTQLARDPSSLANNVKRIQGEARMWRLRVGNWRVIYDDDGIVLFVFKVGPRGSAYD
jgi:mRNA interferase RelE/StbE